MPNGREMVLRERWSGPERGREGVLLESETVLQGREGVDLCAIRQVLQFAVGRERREVRERLEEGDGRESRMQIEGGKETDARAIEGGDGGEKHVEFSKETSDRSVRCQNPFDTFGNAETMAEKNRNFHLPASVKGDPWGESERYSGAQPPSRVECCVLVL